MFTHEWFVDGTLIAGATGEQFDLSGYGLIAGTYTIKAKVSDRTALVRDPDILAKMTQEVSWSVNLVAIPEPASCAFLAAAAGLPVLWRARRRRFAAAA